MPELPDGEPVPVDGALPAGVRADLRDHPGRHPFLAYLHVPFCAVRCGYCDFNTYTPGELGNPSVAGPATTYGDAVLRELDLARGLLGPLRPATVFVGGGTPTLLDATLLGDLVAALDPAPGAEVTVEANPDSVSVASLARLATAGVTRISFGMQSAVPHVLAALDRTHRPEGVAAAVSAAREAGLAVSLDLIYGTPGESVDDWRRSLDEALALAPDHVSAYALTVEDGTRLAARVRRGELPAPTGDDEAAKYELADAVLSAAGFGWYEISNWASDSSTRCRHNLGYWSGADWWGFGPGAHSHVRGVRWWNVKHPTAYATRLAAGSSPAAGREVLTEEQRRDEGVLLGIRLREGLSLDPLEPDGRRAVAGLVAEGLLDGPAAVRDRRAVLTLRGRLLADTVVRRLLGV